MCCLSVDDDEADDELVASAMELLPLLDRWIALMSDTATYQNVDVVVFPCLRPGGGVDPSRLLRTVLEELKVTGHHQQSQMPLPFGVQRSLTLRC